MRKVYVTALVIIAGVFLIACARTENATKEEVIAKCKEAAQLITEKGLEAALPELNNKNGKFVWKNTFVWVMDFTGTHLTHPLNPEMVGMNAANWKDSNGKFAVKESIEVARTKSEGWTEHMYPKPEELKKRTPFTEKKPSKILTYVYRVPGKEIFVAANLPE